MKIVEWLGCGFGFERFGPDRLFNLFFLDPIVARELLDRFASVKSLPNDFRWNAGSSDYGISKRDEGAYPHRPRLVTFAQHRKKSDRTTTLPLNALQRQQRGISQLPPLRRIYVARCRFNEQVDFVGRELLKCERVLDAHLLLYVIDCCSNARQGNLIPAPHGVEDVCFRQVDKRQEASLRKLEDRLKPARAVRPISERRRVHVNEPSRGRNIVAGFKESLISCYRHHSVPLSERRTSANPQTMRRLCIVHRLRRQALRF